jgi:UDP-N-acetylglucosamine 2-epimerase
VEPHTSHTLALCYGTRPQTIKASALRHALSPAWRVLAVDTGQHYDYAMNALLYEQLGVEAPDLFLEVGSGSHAEQTAAILIRAEAVLQEHQPLAVLVIGDTNSTLGATLAAVKLRIPVVHVEAGLRSADRLMAEEINRRAVDAVGSLLCTPSAAATRRLQGERPDARIIETGDVAYDVLQAQGTRLPAPGSITKAAANGGYLFATLHRAELTDRPEVLRGVLNALRMLAQPVVLAVHPRTRSVLQELGATDGGALSLIPAVGYLESLALAASAQAVITDSGGLQREAYWFGTPCITVRAETEWTETVDCGANVLVPPELAPDRLAMTLSDQLRRWGSGKTWDRTSYGDGTAAQRIAKAVHDLIEQR